MHYRDSIVEMTKYATDALFRTARAVPADKLDWKPLDQGRSVKEQLQECANTPLYFMGLVVSDSEKDEETNGQAKEQGSNQTWTIDECEKQCEANTQTLAGLIATLTDEELKQQVELPWGGHASKADVVGLQYWNLVYHQGQISYIQTLYGDMEFH